MSTAPAIEGTFDLLYPEAVTTDFADQVKKMGAAIDWLGWKRPAAA